MDRPPAIDDIVLILTGDHVGKEAIVTGSDFLTGETMLRLALGGDELWILESSVQLITPIPPPEKTVSLPSRALDI